MTKDLSFRLEDIEVSENKNPLVKGTYVNYHILRYVQNNQGDNTFCLVNLRPLFCGCEGVKKEDEDPCQCEVVGEVRAPGGGVAICNPFCACTDDSGCDNYDGG